MLIKHFITSLNVNALTTIVNAKEIIIISLLKSLPLSPNLIIMIALFL